MQKDLLTCILQSCGACNCPAMRWKKEPVDSDRGISVFWTVTLTGQKQRSWSNSPQSTGEVKQDMAAVFTGGGLLSVVGSMKLQAPLGQQGDSHTALI